MLKGNLKLVATAGALALLAALPAQSEEARMKRISINPTAWNAGILDQGLVLQGAKRVLYTSGQVSLEEDATAAFGVRTKYPGDMRAQFIEALAGIDAVLADAGMSRDDIIHMRFFVTDMEAGLANFDVFMEWIGSTENRPPQSFIGVRELVFPDLMIEIEATAATGG